MNTGGIPADRLYSFIRRIEQLQEELDVLNEDKAENFKAAKSAGFDTNVMKAVIKRRRLGKGAAEEADSLLATYERAVENEEAKSPDAGASRTRRREREADSSDNRAAWDTTH